MINITTSSSQKMWEAVKALVKPAFKIIRFVLEMGRGKTPWVHYEMNNGKRRATFISKKEFIGYAWSKDYRKVINLETGDVYRVSGNFCDCEDWYYRVRTGDKPFCKHQKMLSELLSSPLSDLINNPVSGKKKEIYDRLDILLAQLEPGKDLSYIFKCCQKVSRKLLTFDELNKYENHLTKIIKEKELKADPEQKEKKKLNDRINELLHIILGNSWQQKEPEYLQRYFKKVSRKPLTINQLKEYHINLSLLVPLECLNWDELMDKCDRILKKLFPLDPVGYGVKFLQKHFGVNSCHKLSDAEIVQFIRILEEEAIASLGF